MQISFCLRISVADLLEDHRSDRLHLVKGERQRN